VNYLILKSFLIQNCTYLVELIIFYNQIVKIIRFYLKCFGFVKMLVIKYPLRMFENGFFKSPNSNNGFSNFYRWRIQFNLCTNF